MNNLKTQSRMALKWSSLAEVSAKALMPISNILLARLLTPNEFGVIATVTMIISFADLFSDSGFQKFLIQYEFSDESSLYKSANVAFTSNFLLSVLLWLLLCLFNDSIATFVGNEGLGHVIIISGISLPITSFSSIQSAILKRKFEYYKLYLSRILSMLVPIFVTVPLAWLGLSYWSLIIGNIIGNLSVSIVLYVESNWKPKFHFSKSEFDKMFLFSFWSLNESIAMWLSSYIGTFIVGNVLNQYYLGLYKTTVTSVNGIFAIITSATTAVLFSTLSRLQQNRNEYNRTYLNFINMVSVLIIPLGVGVYMYRELITSILLGSKWMEAIPLVGIYGLISSYTLVWGQYISEYFRGVGQPQLNVMMTVLYLFFLIPILFLSASQNFMALVYWSSFAKIIQILIFWTILWIKFQFNPLKILKSTWRAVISSIFMGLFIYICRFFLIGMFFEICIIVLSIIVYFFVYLFLNCKSDLMNIAEIFKGEKNE